MHNYEVQITARHLRKLTANFEVDNKLKIIIILHLLLSM